MQQSGEEQERGKAATEQDGAEQPGEIAADEGNAADLLACRRQSQSAPSPRPEPRYSSPARTWGGTVASRPLAAGVLAPKSNAAKRAHCTARCDRIAIGAS